MEVYKKINEAIENIKNSDLKKGGYNNYSEYAYYTPEQIDKIVRDACEDLNLFVKFDLKRNELGIDGTLEIIDLDTGKESTSVIYTMASDIPSIKATNISQQLGGAMTYTKRYMLMNVFDIVDNNLDFDNTENTKKSQTTKKDNEPEKPWLNRTDVKGTLLASYTTIITEARKKGLKTADLLKFYKISKEVQEFLKKDLAE